MADKSKQMQQAKSAANLQKLQQQAGSEAATVLQMSGAGHTSWMSFTPVTLVFKELR